MADFNFYLNRQGVQGRKGDKGDTGFSPFISVAENTANSYKLRIQNENSEFITDNLRGNAIENTGGTYVRFNQSTGEMYTDGIDNATSSVTGGVLLTPEGGLNNGGSNSDVPTSAQVYDFVTSQITGDLDFNGLSEAIVEGNNVTIDVDSENKTLTINSSYDLSTCVKYTDVSTVVNSSSTNSTVASSKSVYDAIQASLPDLSGYQVKSNLVTSISGLSTDVQYPSAKCVYEAIQNVTPDELIADVPLYIKDITVADKIVRQTYVDNSTSYSMPSGNTNYLRNMTQHAVNPARDIVSYPANKTDIGILAIPYKTGQIVKASQTIGTTNYYYATIGQVYNGYPVQTLGFTSWGGSVTVTHRLPLFSETTVKDAIDQNEGTSFSVEGTSIANWTSSLGTFTYQIKYDDNNDTYTLIVKYPNGTFNQTYTNDSAYYNTLKNTNYVLIVSSSAPKDVGIVSESDNADLATVDLSTLNFKSIDDFYSDDTPLGTHIYLDTSTSLNSSSTHLTVPTSKTVYDAIQSSAQTYTEGTGISILNNTISVNYDSAKGLAANGTTGALGVRVDGTTIDFDSSGNLSYVGTMPTVTVDQVYDGTSTNAQSGVAIANAGFLTSVPTATTSAQGAVQPDGTTITINNGVISAVAQAPSTIDGGEEQVTP